MTEKVIDFYKIRYCPICEEYRAFDYDSSIKHSRCVICGSGFGTKITIKHLKQLNQKVKALERLKEILLKDKKIYCEGQIYRYIDNLLEKISSMEKH